MYSYAFEAVTQDRIATYRREADTMRLLASRHPETSWFARFTSNRVPAAGATPTVSGVAGCCA